MPPLNTATPSITVMVLAAVPEPQAPLRLTPPMEVTPAVAPVHAEPVEQFAAGFAAPFVGIDLEPPVDRVPDRAVTLTGEKTAPGRDRHMIRRNRGSKCQDRQSDSSEAHDVVFFSLKELVGYLTVRRKTLT